MLFRNVSRCGVAAAAIFLAGCADSVSPVPVHAPDPTLARDDASIAAFVPQDLGFLPGDINSTGYAINTAGDVAGFSSDGTGLHATFWIGTTPTNVSPPGWLYSTLRSINDAGVVVGLAQDASLNGTGFLWRPAVGFTFFAPYLHGMETSVRDVNNSDVVVGSYWSATASQTHAYRYTVAGGIVDIHPAGYTRSEALAISDNGTIVGMVLAPGGNHAARWTAAGAFLDLGTLGGNSSYAADVNSLGTIIGESTTTAGGTIAFQWRSTTGMVNTGVQATPTGLNGGGRAVGYNLSQIAGTKLGMGPVTSLPGLPGTSQSIAYGVNRCGSIAGMDKVVAVAHAVRWTQPACDP